MTAAETVRKADGRRPAGAAAVAVRAVTSALAVLAALALAVVLREGPVAAATPAPRQPASVVRLATAAPGGRLHEVGEKIVTLWREALPGWTVTAVATGGSPQNVELLADGDVEAALLTGEAAYEAFRGLGRWSGRPRERYEGLRLLARLYPDVVHLVTRRGSQPSMVLGVGLPGSRDEHFARHVFGRWTGPGGDGMRMGYLPLEEALEHYHLGWIDGVVHLAPVPSPALEAALALSRPGTMELTSLDETMLAAAEELGWTEPFVVPAGTYPRQLEPVHTVAVPVVVVVRADMDPALAARLAEAVHRGRARLETASPRLPWDPSLPGGEGSLLPVHPGARRVP